MVMWEYSKIGQPNYTEIILKTGAGNCDQMAHVACEMIRTNGGTAQVWVCQVHTFVVVGTIPTGLSQTLDFQETGWADLWISDPWAAITCPAKDYMRTLEIKMITWDLEDILVFFYDGNAYRWERANHPDWLRLLLTTTKTQSHNRREQARYPVSDPVTTMRSEPLLILTPGVRVVVVSPLLKSIPGRQEYGHAFLFRRT